MHFSENNPCFISPLDTRVTHGCFKTCAQFHLSSIRKCQTWKVSSEGRYGICRTKSKRPDLFQQCNFYPCELVSILQVYINTISFRFPEFSWFVKILDKSRLWPRTCERIDQYWVELRGGKKNFGLSLKLMMHFTFPPHHHWSRFFAPVFICDCIFICIFAFAIESQINDGLTLFHTVTISSS